MEKPMTRNTFTAAAVRTVASTVVASVLVAALPQIGFAASDAGIWKIDPSRSKLNASTVTLTIMRAENATPAAGSFIVISGTGVYRVTGATASAGIRPVDFTNMTRTGAAVLIGTHPRSPDPCGFACRAGLPEPVRTVTFRVVKSGEQQVKDMLASDDQNW